MINGHKSKKVLNFACDERSKERGEKRSDEEGGLVMWMRGYAVCFFCCRFAPAFRPSLLVNSYLTKAVDALRDEMGER